MEPASSNSSRSNSVWIHALVLAIFAGAIYFWLRPSVFNYDGYVYRLRALEPFQGSFVNPHHLLWYPVQLLLAKAAEFLESSTTVPFQIFGILINCTTLFFFHRLMHKALGSQALAAAATVFVAFSPKFWFMGFQNQPYTLVYLFTVLYLLAWCKGEGGPPSAQQLLAAGLAVAAATFFQQAVALLVPAGALALLVAGPEPWRRRLVRSLIWGASTTLLVLGVYLGMARFAGVGGAQGFVGWITQYLEAQHPLQIRFPDSLAKCVMGILRSVAQTYKVENFLRDRYSAATILGFYLGLGLLTCVLAVALLRKTEFRVRVWELVRQNTLFTVSLFSAAAWSVFVFAWEPSSYYWSLNLFPVVLCFGLLLLGQARCCPLMLAAALLLLSAWNVYANHAWDKAESVNAPEPLLASIQSQLGSRDVFFVLGKDWFGDMDYDLLFECLARSSRSPGRTILQDLIMKPGGATSWPRELAKEIEATLEAGGRVFVADHVFWPNSYIDLPQAQDPFGEYIHEEYKGINGPKLRQEIEQFFQRYELVDSNFKIGRDAFLEVQRQ